MLNARIGFLLGIRHIQRTSVWTTILIIFVVVCTFINLVAVSGILGGIVKGALNETRTYGVGDIVISPLETEDRVLETDRIIRELEKYPEIHSYSPRYKELATIEANYKNRDLGSKRDIIAVEVTGVDPVRENETLNLASLITEGSYFEPDEQESILIGKFYIDRYAEEYGDIYNSFKDVYPGDKVRVTVGSQTKELTVKGIVDSKIDFIGLSVYIPEKEFRRLFNRQDRNVDDIVIRTKPGVDEALLRDNLMRSGLGEVGKVETFAEGIPKFINDVEDTFGLLGLFIGVVGITVASITIFIIIFINILTRRRQIGILKAIGISKRAIQYSYITQACFYAVIGSTIGVLVVVFGVIPYFEAHPIDFPYSDVSLETTPLGLIIRIVSLSGVMVLAGFVPAWLITRQNTLNAILGRK